jgi:hypothetical protein
MMALSNLHFANAKQEIIKRIQSMVILCIFCKEETRMTASVIDFEPCATGAYVTAFFICPNCQNKFFVNFQDLGKIRK